MKILFWGTPSYAVPSLEALVQAGHQIVSAETAPKTGGHQLEQLISHRMPELIVDGLQFSQVLLDTAGTRVGNDARRNRTTSPGNYVSAASLIHLCGMHYHEIQS